MCSYRDDLPPTSISDRSSRENKTGSWRNFKPVINMDDCILCGICWKFCPEPSIDWDEDEGPEVDYEYCKGCGICAEECPVDAIEMVKEGED